MNESFWIVSGKVFWSFMLFYIVLETGVRIALAWRKFNRWLKNG